MNKHVKEDFCPLCIIPIVTAVAGGVSTTAGVMTEDEKRKKNKKRILIIVGIILTILSLVVFCIWKYYLKKNCKTCIA